MIYRTTWTTYSNWVIKQYASLGRGATKDPIFSEETFVSPGTNPYYMIMLEYI